MLANTRRLQARYIGRMQRRPSSPFPWQRLLVLTALVLWAHVALLSNPPAAWMVAPQAAASMTTRTIAATPALAPAPVSALPGVGLPSPRATAKPPRPLPKKAAAPPPNLMPNTPLAQSNIAQAAPEIVAPNLPTMTDTLAIATAQEPEPAALAAQPTATPTPLPSLTDTASPTPTSQATAAAVALPPGRDSGKEPTPEVALKFPAPGKLSYSAAMLRAGQPLSGAGTLEWSTDGRQYQLRLESSAVFVTFISQTSVGSLAADGLQPERFADKRINRSEKATHFSRDGAGGGGRITFSGNQRPVALPRGAQDRLSVLVQLAALAAGNPAVFSSTNPQPIPVASSEGLESWQFVLAGEETVQVPAGSARALHVVRNPRQEYDSRLELWLAPALGYLPVRMRQTEANGNTSDLQLRSPALPRP